MKYYLRNVKKIVCNKFEPMFGDIVELKNKTGK